MRIARFEVETLEIKPLAQSVALTMNVGTSSQTTSYANETDDMIIAVEEMYYFRNSSEQVNMIVLRRGAISSYVDIIGAAGGSGAIFGSELSFIKEASKALQEYCLKKDLGCTEVQDSGWALAADLKRFAFEDGAPDGDVF